MVNQVIQSVNLPNDQTFEIGKIIVKSNEFTFDDDDVKSLDLIDQ